MGIRKRFCFLCVILIYQSINEWMVCLSLRSQLLQGHTESFLHPEPLPGTGRGSECELNEQVKADLMVISLTSSCS